MAFDRSKFSGAKQSALKDVQKSAKENSKSFSNSSRAEFHNVDDGRNVFRILPPHNENDPSYLPKRVAMLECEVSEWKDGAETGKKEIRNKNIFIATQHGGLPKDPIELYIEYVRNRANDEIDNKEDRQKFLSPITGWKDKKGVWNWGIAPKTSFVCYALKDGKIGRLELYESWVKEMDKLAITEGADEVIGVDPFSDPNEGFPLIITKGKDDKNKTTYSITKDEPSRAKRESWEEFFERVMVTDEQLAELEKQEPLPTLYGKDVYSTTDWDLSIDGLRRFDEKNKYGIFDNDEFLAELQELETKVPAPKEDDQKKTGEDVKGMFDKKSDAPARTYTKPDVKEEAAETNTEEKPEEVDDAVTPAEMRLALKKFVRKEFGDQYVDQIPTGKELEKWYSLYVDGDGDELPIKLNTDSEVKNEPVKEEKSAPATAPQSEAKEVGNSVDPSGSLDDNELTSHIDRLRNRRNANRG